MNTTQTQDEAFLSVKKVEKRYSISDSTLYQWSKNGMFPKPYKLGPKLSRWKLSELEAWEQQGREGAV